MSDRRTQLRDWYGFDFPDDLLGVWELAKQINRKEPHEAFEPAALHLSGVFDVLAGEFDDEPPLDPLWTHGMSYWDSPEMFTVFWGECDGYHLGYWFDDPAEPPTCVVGYYNNDAYDLSRFPANLFLTIKRELEYGHVGAEENRDDEPKFYDKLLARIAKVREALQPHLPGAAKRRTQIGQAYLDRYTDADVSDDGIVGETWGSECIRAPKRLYRRPSARDESIWDEVQEIEGARRWLLEARQAIDDGYPATALKLGKDVFRLGDQSLQRESCEVMQSAYHALGRPLLAEVLKARQEQRETWDAERKK